MTVKASGDAGEALSRFQFSTIAAGWADDVMPRILSAVNAATPVGKPQPEGNRGTHEPGYLRSRNRVVRRTVPGALQVVWMNDADYAGYVIGGTSAHPISAPGQGPGSLHAKALHFNGADGGVFRKTVMHPGTRANPYHLTGYATVAREVLAVLDQKITESFGG
jgi:hypothetical protein